MSISELALALESLARTCPQSADPRIRTTLQSLLSHSQDLLETQSTTAAEHFRKIARCVVRLRGRANAHLRLQILHDCCHHLYLSGDAISAVDLAEHGVELARRAGRSIDLRRFLNMLGALCGDIGDRGRSIECHSMSLELATNLGDRRGQYTAWSNLSVLFVDSGLYSEATACAARALDFVDPNSSDAGDMRARALTNTALASLYLGDLDEAEENASKAVALTPEPVSLASAVIRLVRELNLVMVLISRANYSQAIHHSNCMQSIAARFPSARTEGIARLCKGITHVYRGDAELGLKDVEDVAESFKGTMVPMYVDSLSFLARLYSDLDRPDDALRVVRDLLANAKSFKSDAAITRMQALGLSDSTLRSQARRNLTEHKNKEAELRIRVAEREVGRNRQEMLERMAVAADIREDISGEHGYRVGRLTALLARELGWNREACTAIDIAARLHDIGKIGIPEKILLDERTLREAEKQFIASHTLVGAEVLSKSEIPQVRIAEEIARCHHEWWDGSGYPRGLKGLAIPRSARIVALADVFDAMTHGRPYAKAIPIESALDEIARLRGRQFDPELTDHFLALVRRLAAENPDLDAFLGKAARNSPFLRARARIKEMLAQGRDSAALSDYPPAPGSPLN